MRGLVPLSNHESVFSPVVCLLPVQRFSLYKTNECPVSNTEIQDIDERAGGRVVFSRLPAGLGTKTMSRFDNQISNDTLIVGNEDQQALSMRFWKLLKERGSTMVGHD